MLEHYAVWFVARFRLAVDDGWKDLESLDHP
jgi:hypothetical protein